MHPGAPAASVDRKKMRMRMSAESSFGMLSSRGRNFWSAGGPICGEKRPAARDQMEKHGFLQQTFLLLCSDHLISP
eukprot:840-Rhodomonas_salina.3